LSASASLVGIIANPASGKDIRRLIAHATTTDNRGKISTLRRALIGLGAMGVKRVAIMPDSYHLGAQAARGLDTAGPLPSIELLDIPVTNQARDSELAARRLCEGNAAAIIVLGGDGTVRAVSKGSGSVPLLPISTGTNNVLPEFVEGTIAGLAAGALATGRLSLEQVAIHHKWLELCVNGESRDRALVDAVVLKGRFVGARAVWDLADVQQIVVTRAHPWSIGLSAIAGVVRPIGPEEPVGLALSLRGRVSPQEPISPGRVFAAIGPGLIVGVDICAMRDLAIGDRVELTASEPIIVALDGEREVLLHEGDRLTLTLHDDGPWILQVERIMEEMVARGMFARAKSLTEAGS